MKDLHQRSDHSSHKKGLSRDSASSQNSVPLLLNIGAVLSGDQYQKAITDSPQRPIIERSPASLLLTQTLPH